MTETRPPAVANMFYPGDRQELQSMLHSLFNNVAARGSLNQTWQASLKPLPANQPKALVVPHAGYIYSGPIAASAYQHIKPFADHIHSVVLIGPSHRVALSGIACSSAKRFATPLGEVQVDQARIQPLLDAGLVKVLDAAHQQEHSLEVHIPFLQTLLPDFRLIPLVAGDADAEQVARVLDALWGDPSTLIVISSDLSHFHQYSRACEIDLATHHAIEHCDIESIHANTACGSVPLKGLLLLAKEKNMTVTTIDYCNSGDTAGDRDRVVGYGAYGVY